MILNRIAIALLSLAIGIATAGAEVTVKMLHVEQNPQASGFWKEIAQSFMASHPGVKVDVQYLENEAYKKKLTTLLQSPDRPHIIYSWGGGVMREQVKAGVLEDITAPMNAGNWKDRFLPAGVQAYTLDNKIYGVPFQLSQV